MTNLALKKSDNFKKVEKFLTELLKNTNYKILTCRSHENKYKIFDGIAIIKKDRQEFDSEDWVFVSKICDNEDNILKNLTKDWNFRSAVLIKI